MPCSHAGASGPATTTPFAPRTSSTCLLPTHPPHIRTHTHAPPVAGNILVGRGGRVGLLDYGQSKQLPDDQRLAFAHLVLALNK